MMNRRYVLISPCRDEARFMKRTLDSVIAQSQPPGLWVIVDDGSSDESPAILAEYAEKHPWIRVVRREDRGGRAVGPGVIEAFYAGLDTVDLSEFDYLCKLDLDLDLPEHYFERLMDRMEATPRLGSCSGKPYYPHPETGELISEGCGDETSIGASKFYRVSCFEQVGGFVRQVMWDGIDCHRCRMAGWIAQSWDEEELRFIHLRPMGSSQQSIWTGRKRHGYGQWFMGTGFVYMTASAMARMMKRPFVLGGLAMWWGYTRSMALRLPRYDDLEFRRFLRRYQWMAIFKGKAAAVERINREQASKWRPPAAQSAGELVGQA